MEKQELLFYHAYEDFYSMAKKSKAFQVFCKEAFGEDFSQDGFSDVAQVNRIIPLVPKGREAHVLDIGCGNGKMLRYLQQKTGCEIHGFDYAENAIAEACKMTNKADFREGIIGEIDYPKESFDVITSMDTMYFAQDMEAFVAQAYGWLKKGGIFFVAYQEGDVMPKTENVNTTVLSKALEHLEIPYEVEDITRETYEMLKKKGEVAEHFKTAFEEEGNSDWYEMLMWQTQCAKESYEKFQTEMARYIYRIKK